MLDDHEKLDYLDSKMQYKINGSYLEFSNSDISGTVRYDLVSDQFVIEGQTMATKTINYRAANPLWRNYSYAGSGLPYPNHVIAYENTVNQGTIPVNGGRFTLKLSHPSEYYVDLGKKLLKPHVHLHLVDPNRTITLVIGDFLPYRSLTNLPNHPDRTIGR